MKDEVKTKSELEKFLESLNQEMAPEKSAGFENRIDFRQAKIHMEAVKAFNESMKDKNGQRN